MAEKHRFTFTAFDQRVTSPTGAATTLYSSHATYELLGMFDQLALHMTAKQVVGSSPPTLTVVTSHSGDGRWWVPKKTMITETLNPNQEVPFWGFDDGSDPMLQYVRIETTISGPANASADVQIVATINDVRETEFGGLMRRRLERQRKDLENAFSSCWELLHGGDWLDTSNEWIEVLTTADSHGHVPAARGGFIVKRHDSWYVAEDAQICIKAGGKAELSKPGATAEVDLGHPGKHGAPGAC